MSPFVPRGDIISITVLQYWGFFISIPFENHQAISLVKEFARIKIEIDLYIIIHTNLTTIAIF